MNAAKKRVLVVDDDATTRMLEVFLLTDAGFSVTYAGNGEAGIRQMQQTSPDLVVLDIKLPGIDGWGVLEHIIQMAAPPPVIVLTGLPAFHMPEHLKPYIRHVLAKPFEPVDLLNVCRRLVTA